MEYSSAIGIPVERNNPLFNDADKFFQDIVYPGKAPLSPRNKAFFKNGQLVDAPNSAYEFNVQVKVRGFHLLSGTLSYKVADEAYDFTLKVNYGAVAKKAQTTRLPEIRSNDSYLPTLTEAQWKTHLKDTCQNPQNYHYAFFPVKNNYQVAPYANYGYTNYYDFASQSFPLKAPADGVHDEGFNWTTSNTPFFKLTYIVKKVIEYLGFQADGSFFNADNDKLYIYNRYDVNRGIGGAAPIAPSMNIYSSMTFMPNITIADFFKLLRLRLRASFSFNLENTTVLVDNIEESLSRKKVIDIDQFIESVTEIESAKKKGYTVTLKPDPENPLYSIGGKSYPTNRLVIAEGGEEIEIDCGTLKQTESGPTTNQELRIMWPPQQNNDFTTSNTWPLLLLKYNGMQPKQVGPVNSFYPTAEAFDLTLKDSVYFEFLNNAKKLSITANIPPAELKKVNNHNGVIVFTSKEGAKTPALIEKMNYDLANKSLLKVKMNVLTLELNEYPARVELLAATGQSPISTNTMDLYKIYFDPSKHNFTKVQPEYVIPGMTTSCDTIDVPTDSGGAGGQIGLVTRIGGPYATNGYQVRVREAQPQYAERFGVKYYFTKAANYWYTNIPYPLSMGFFAANGLNPALTVPQQQVNNGLAFEHLWIVF